jgi:hypothetical protein
MNKHIITFIYVALGATFFTLVGTILPKAYLQYIDKTEYVRFVDNISLDRKLYAPCDEMKALLKLDSRVASPITTQFRLKRIQDGIITIVFERKSTSFVRPTNGIETIAATYKVPCELPNGTYFFTGIITYDVEGIEKNYSFTTEQFRVNTDIPEIIQNL